MNERTSESRRRGTFVSVVIPCLNEGRTIRRCISDALSGIASTGLAGEVVVSDNGSSDQSVDLAAGAGARVVSCETKGYGCAVRYGVEKSRGDLIVMGDGDGSYDLANITPLIAALVGGAEFVVGNRFRGGIEPGAMPRMNRYLGTPGLTLLVKLLFGAPVGDVNCGLRGFTRAAYDAMAPRAWGMELATEMIARAAQVGLKIAEVPTVLRPDGRDRPPHLRPWRDGWRHVRLLLALRAGTPFTPRPRASRVAIASDSPVRA